jgi:hypothetical protein
VLSVDRDRTPLGEVAQGISDAPARRSVAPCRGGLDPAKHRNLVLLVGAGVSRQAGDAFPGWIGWDIPSC